ncbi:MAG: asparaginase domain-containing protein [Candidatus Peregrinibacteria bacterium]|nr:asparaginase domain-containing protein [Candidatus Peregrinibacteria bacterium]
MKHHISILLTGGTIDSRFDIVQEAIVVNHKSGVKEFLDDLDLHITYDIKDICLKDSRAINNDDRMKLLNSIIQGESKYYLITHGTYTMAETAKFLEKHHDKIGDKTVVLVGSMKPLKEFVHSDAPFNLGFAIATLIASPPGIYLTMNGRAFHPENVSKNIEYGRFEALTQEDPESISTRESLAS